VGGAVAERRVESRVPAIDLRVLQATLRPGCPVRILDVSPSGIHVETDRALRPGACVHVRVVFETWTLIAVARVLRCVVAALHPEAGVTYRGALLFEERCTNMPVVAGQIPAVS